MVRDKLKKVNIKVILLVLFGFGLIFIGVGSLNIKLGASKVNSSKKFASGDSFITELSSSSPSVVAGDSVTLTVKLLNININSGDKGIGVLSFKLDYDSDVFSLTSSSSDVGKISTNNNGDYIIVMNDGKVLTADTTVFTFTLKSKSNVNNVNSLISLSNILGSAGSSVSSKNTSLTVLVKDEGAPRVTFDVKNPNAYAKSHSATISVVDSDLDNSSLKYQWVQGNTKPSEASFTDTFTNNQTITKDGLTGNNWYLWVLAKDTKKNTSIVRSEAFYFDNTAPTCNITSDGSNLIVNGSDSQSGLDTLPYSFDNINFTNVNKKSISSNGTYKAYVRDKVGNVAECSYVVNVTAPTIAISNSQTLPTKSLNVTINALKGAYELDTNNTYQYYLSSSSTMLTDGEWTNYQSGESFTIGAKKDGIYYLFVKAITDTASNKSTDSFNDTFVIDNVTYHRFGPYIFDNTSPSCSITSSTSKYTNTNLVLTVTGNDENGLSDAAYSFDGVNFSHNYQKTVSENGKYSAYVKDYAGNVNSCSIDVNNIDKDRPVINIKNNGSLQYSKTHSSEVVVNDIKLAENGLKYQWTTDTVQPDLSSFTTLFTNNTTISKSSYSGDYYLWIYAIDEAGNYTVARSEVFKFDNTLPTAPTISANIKNGETAESDVLLQIDSSTALSGIKKYQYSLNNGVSFIDYDSSKKITFTEEGEYSVIARAVSNVDINGVNSKSFSFKIKHSPMALTMKKSTSLPTNKDVVVTITSSTKLLPLAGFSLSSDGYSLSKSYSENTTGDKVVVTDIYGNSETQTIVISNIDKEKPKLSVTYDRSEDSVEAVIKANEELDAKSGFVLSVDKKELSKVYFENGTFQESFCDVAGNCTDILLNIDGIKKNDLNISLSYELQNDGAEKIIISSPNELSSLEGFQLSSDKHSLSKMIYSDIDKEYTVKDVLGNSRVVKIKYYFVNEPLNIKVNYSITKLSNENVVVTLTANPELKETEGFSLSDDKYSLTKVYMTNTKETILVESVDGLQKDITINISNIDKEKPTIKGVMNNGVYDSIKLEFNKNVKTIKVVKNGVLQEYKMGDVINSPGDYVITIIDEVGNSSTYNISLRKNGELVSVPDTSSNYSKLFIVVGVLEVIVGILLFSQVGLKGKVNLSLILLVILVAKFSNNSMAASTTAIDLNGYEIKDNYLLNVEASTSYSNMKSNLFDKSVTVKRSDSELSSSSYVGTGDLLTYGSDNYRVIIKGDITGDGSVDYNDYGKLILVLLSKSNFNEYEAKAADYNVDEVIDISDLYYINKRLNSTYVIKPKGIRVVSANTKLKASSSTKIVAQVYPVNVSDDTYDSRVVYGNSVSVSNNTVKGIDAGNAIVLVSSNANPALNTTLTFEIESIPVTGVSLSKDSATINIEESNSTSITPTISPSNATNKNVVYSSSNSSVAKVSSTGKITGVFPGVAVITVKSAEDSSKKATIKVLVQNDGKNYVNVNSATRSLYTQYVVSAHPSTIIQGFDISKNYIFTVQNLYSTSTDMNTNSLFINKHPRPGVSGSDSNMSLYGFGHGTNIAFEWANSKYNDTSDAYMWLAGGHYTWNNDNSKFSFDVTRDGAFPTRLAYHGNSTYTSNSVSFDTRSSVSRNDIKLYNGKNYSTTALSSKYYNIYKFYKTRSNEQVAIDTTNNLFIIRVTGSSGQIFSIYKLTDIKNSSVDYIDGNIPKLATFTIPKTPLDFQEFDIAGDYVYVYYGESNRNGTQNSQGYVALYDFLGNEKFNKKVYSTSTSIFEEPEGIKVYKESGKYVAYLGSSLVSGSQKYVKICTFK